MKVCLFGLKMNYTKPTAVIIFHTITGVSNSMQLIAAIVIIKQSDMMCKVILRQHHIFGNIKYQQCSTVFSFLGWGEG
jgi:hypothetical protein